MQRPRFAPRYLPITKLDERPWSAQTPVYRALGYRFFVRSQVKDLALYVEEMFQTLSDVRDDRHQAPPTAFSIIDRGPTHKGRYGLYVGESRISLSADPGVIVRALVNQVNLAAVRSSESSHTIFHAAAAELDGAVVLLPAAMERGKTTTVAGLLTRGLSYITDEAFAVDRSTREVLPFPKPLSVDRGSWAVLAAHAPDREAFAGQWHLSPTRFPAGVSRRPGLPRFVIAPNYSPGIPTQLTPVSRGTMLRHLATCTFHFHDRPQAHLDLMSELLGGAACYQLDISDLQQGLDLICAAITTPSDGT